tara:strand:- start:227 stop:886 length:660 start_codon:yes stop_codon:yes gene_type:complete
MKNILFTLTLLISFASFGQRAEDYYSSGNEKWKSDKYGAIDDYKEAIKYSSDTDYWRLYNSYRNIGVAYRFIAEKLQIREQSNDRKSQYAIEQEYWFNSAFHLKKAIEYADLCDSCINIDVLYEDLSEMIIRVFDKELIQLLKLPKNETALTYLSKAIELNPSAKRYASRAWIYSKELGGWPYRDKDKPNLPKACEDALRANKLGIEYPYIIDILKKCN